MNRTKMAERPMPLAIAGARGGLYVPKPKSSSASADHLQHLERPQSIFRIDRSSGRFTTVSNSVLRDRRLSFRARGIMANLLSNCDDWEITQKALESEGTEGREAIRAGMCELERFGYAEREAIRGPRGRFLGWRWVIRENPDPPSDGKPSSGEESYGAPSDGKPTVGKPSIKKDYGHKDEEEETRSKLEVRPECEKGAQPENPTLVLIAERLFSTPESALTAKDRQAFRAGCLEGVELSEVDVEVISQHREANPGKYLEHLPAFLAKRHEQLRKAREWVNRKASVAASPNAKPKTGASERKGRFPSAIRKELQETREKLGNLKNSEGSFRYIYEHTDPEVPDYTERKKVLTDKAKAEVQALDATVAALEAELRAAEEREKEVSK